MARMEKIVAFAFVLSLALVMISKDVDIGVQALQSPGLVQCIRDKPCPQGTGLECDFYKIAILPCTCEVVVECDPYATGCRERTSGGGFRSCGN
ncbi:hypothetical protein SUGI_1018460 [Cryptomeria japonica]|nr:hypothetical protein SUGI_1018460 [Cryptomeria japonica]